MALGPVSSLRPSFPDHCQAAVVRLKAPYAAYDRLEVPVHMLHGALTAY
jgi:hypothetical protein